MNNKKVFTFGAEIEKPVASLQTVEPHGVSQKYFDYLANCAQQRNDKWHYHFSDIRPKIKIGVNSTTFGEQGLDNAFNLLETSFPYTSGKNGLTKLFKLMLEDLKITQAALAKENATIINMSIHPLGKTDKKTYQQYVVPKGIYKFIWHRGWDHAAGIDAKAQNSPATGVNSYEAVDTLSVILGFSSVFIALFANSPIAEGKVTQDKEYRIRIWERMMKNSKSPGDVITAKFPQKRFYTLKDYFNWMFGKNTNILFVINKDSKDYKTSGGLVLIDDKPSVLEFLTKLNWQGTDFKTKNKTRITPHLAHLEMMQFAQFCGVRIRWAFDHNKITVQDFLHAMDKNKVEDLFNKTTKYMYIEGRDPGANFPDQELLNIDKKIALSTFIAPSALQAGLLNNLPKAVKLLNKYQWTTLANLRESAIKRGLEDETVYNLAKKVIKFSEQGLAKNEHWMLSYPYWVLKTKMNGADRALKQLGNNSDRKSIKQLVLHRKVVLP